MTPSTGSVGARGNQAATRFDAQKGNPMPEHFEPTKAAIAALPDLIEALTQCMMVLIDNGTSDQAKAAHKAGQRALGKALGASYEKQMERAMFAIRLRQCFYLLVKCTGFVREMVPASNSEQLLKELRAFIQLMEDGGYRI